MLLGFTRAADAADCSVIVLRAFSAASSLCCASHTLLHALHPQGSRMRNIKTEYVSCPSCGRTLFDLQEVRWGCCSLCYARGSLLSLATPAAASRLEPCAVALPCCLR